MATHALSTSARSRRRPWTSYRKEIEATVDRLITILNEIDGDPDLEPSLGALEDHPSGGGILRQDGAWGVTYADRRGDQRRWAAGTTDDREQDGGDENEEMNEDGGDVVDQPHDADDEGDIEHSLGSSNIDPDKPDTLDQTQWGLGAEADHYQTPAWAYGEGKKAAREAERELDRMLHGSAPTQHSNVRLLRPGEAFWRPR